MMKINFFKKSIILSCLVFVAVPVCQLQSADRPPKPILYGEAELFTAILRGPLAGYSQSINLEHGKSSNRAILVGAALNVVRILNDGFALWNASRKGDLAYVNNGKSFQQYLTLMFVLQDFLSLCDNTKNMWDKWKNRHETDEVFEPVQTELERLSAEKLTRTVQRLVTYVLPFVETVAATLRAVDTLKFEADRNDKLELTSYLCFVAMFGCRNLSEYLQTKQGSLKQNWAIAKAVISATLILVDLKLHDKRRVAEVDAANVARVAEVARIQREAETAKEVAVNAKEKEVTDRLNGVADNRVWAANFDAGKIITETQRLAEEQVCAAETRRQLAVMQAIEVGKQKTQAYVELAVANKEIERLRQVHADEIQRIKEEADRQASDVYAAALAKVEVETAQANLQEYLKLGLPREVVGGVWGFGAAPKSGELSDVEVSRLAELRNIANKQERSNFLGTLGTNKKFQTIISKVTDQALKDFLQTLHDQQAKASSSSSRTSSRK